MVTRAKKPQLKLNIKDVVGGHVRRLRTESGLTQLVLAEECGIFRTYLSRAENGDANLTITVLAALAENLNVEIAEFFRE
jgi:transcriptional regulator with XRE-family HTH domain